MNRTEPVEHPKQSSSYITNTVFRSTAFYLATVFGNISLNWPTQCRTPLTQNVSYNKTICYAHDIYTTQWLYGNSICQSAEHDPV